MPRRRPHNPAKPAGTRPSITRRGLLKGSAALGATAAVVSLLPGCTNSADSSSARQPASVSARDATSILDSYEEVDLTLTTESEWSIAAGNVLHPAEGTWLSVLASSDSANPMCVARSFSRASGATLDVVSAPISEGVNWVIYDASCSDEVYAWVELDTITRDWKLYAAPFSDGTLSATPSTLWEGNKNYDPPQLACGGSKVLWLVMPALSGSKTTSHSFCYLWKAGEQSAQAVVESPGRFAAMPSISGETVTLAPRVERDDNSVYYGITTYSLTDDLKTVVDQLVLPASIRPFRATRIGDTFAFSIEANYDSGGLFGNMGTYIGTEDSSWVRLAREPSAEVVGNGKGIYIIKSRSSYFVVDVPNETYAILSACNNCVDYGEYPATTGEVAHFCTYATIKNAETGEPASVTVRSFTL